MAVTPDEMRQAASIVERTKAEHARRDGKPWPVSDFVPQDLRQMADRWEYEDAESDELSKALALAIFEAMWDGQQVPTAEVLKLYIKAGDALIRAGWVERKSAPKGQAAQMIPSVKAAWLPGAHGG